MHSAIDMTNQSRGPAGLIAVMSWLIQVTITAVMPPITAFMDSSSEMNVLASESR